VVLDDIVEVLTAALAERDVAIAGLVAMLAEMRADNALLAARIDKIDPPDSAPLPGFLSLKEAAFACGFSDETVRQWARDGGVTATKEGGTWRVELVSVMERAGRKLG
jgi:excisionase family DNA binding protein